MIGNKMTSSTLWRVTPVGWLAITLGIIAESTSNALRAYGLGAHLDRFTFHYQGYTVSLAGAVLVLAAVAISLAQARAAWVALTPGRPARQRIVAGLAALLLLAISITAFASHILEAQRAKSGGETAAARDYKRAEAAHKKADDELKALGEPRPVSVIQAEIAAAKIDMAVWRRSQQCSDISREDTRTLCEPVVALYKERGNAARKLELEPEVKRLRDRLATMTPPVDEASTAASVVALWWAWIMGLGVVFIATFGSVIYATVETVEVRTPSLPPPPPAPPIDDKAPPSTGGTRPKSRDEALADLRTLLQAGQSPPSQEWLKDRWHVGSKGTISKWLAHWESTGELPGNRLIEGRCKTVVS